MSASQIIYRLIAEIKRIEKENIITNLIQQLTFAIRAKIIAIKK